MVGSQRMACAALQVMKVFMMCGFGQRILDVLGTADERGSSCITHWPAPLEKREAVGVIRSRCARDHDLLPGPRDRRRRHRDARKPTYALEAGPQPHLDEGPRHAARGSDCADVDQRRRGKRKDYSTSLLQGEGVGNRGFAGRARTQARVTVTRDWLACAAQRSR